MKYPSNWFVGISKDDQKKMIDILQYSIVIKRLIEMIEVKQKSLGPSRSDYENPSWAYMQAHKNGEALAYEEILKLLRPTEK